ncbi:M1 family aminopeptidase [Pedobacter puniceum]|uniref:Aminopeptidase N n=1 Tax=Pedobacter puniceum TaxID=2666136 RepID=A0A7K0FQ78_9SPHI|nr:M1 family aminopeptidase [Pedobacter puniceum]MRX48012.1 M1 family peptidase [Pedobacter puniceum]
MFYHFFRFLSVIALLFSLNQSSFSQEQKIYRATAEKINSLIHTKLDVSFDYQKRRLIGKAWITLKPHFYNTDSLTLDAKGMDIKNVALVANNKLNKLNFSYDSLKLKIKLDKTYSSKENYTVYIDYVAKPDELKAKGSAAITNAKGLYFINPDSTVQNKPVQIWTQGETESSSVWFPTLDSPNQKTTQEISITAPAKYTTLSNGILVGKKTNKDGTRTDTWKMDKPHAPYLFMMAVGNFKIYQDKWKNIPVDYYLEPEYAPYAKNIFGNTPEMMTFFSNKLGIDYPWDKYAQVVVRDFVSGAMENTTATIHGDFVQQTDRELLDGSAGEDVIAHELFHHWFGDYVTAESWSNLSVNESFADISETLWNEYKFGKDAGDAHNYEAMQAYLNNPSAKSKHLIRFHYEDKEDMFDVVSYQKGGRILNMLRHYIGEDAFYKSLNLYLKSNAFKTGEAHQLRLAFEEVTGKDLNWFFNQWYFREGHPELNIKYNWNDATKTQQVILSQNQKTDVFLLPMKIDIYVGGKKERHDYFMSKKADTLNFILNKKADLVNVDADKIILTKKIDEKSLNEYAFQYDNAPLYVDRLEALNAAIKNSSEAIAQTIIQNALKDKYYKIRIKAIDALKLDQASVKNKSLPILKNLAKADEKPLVQAAAITALSSLKDNTNELLFKEALKSKSYAVQGAALQALATTNKKDALQLAKSLEQDSRGPLSVALVSLYAAEGSENNFNFVSKAFKDGGIEEKFQMMQRYVGMLGKVKSASVFNENIDLLKGIGIQYKSYGIDKYVIGLLNNLLKIKTEQLNAGYTQAKADLDNQIEYLKTNIAVLEKL